MDVAIDDEFEPIYLVDKDKTKTDADLQEQLKHGEEEFYLTFKDSSGKPVDVGAVALTFHMPAMGTMALAGKRVESAALGCFIHQASQQETGTGGAP